MKQSKECKLRVEIGRFTLLKVGKCNILNHAS